MSVLVHEPSSSQSESHHLSSCSGPPSFREKALSFSAIPMDATLVGSSNFNWNQSPLRAPLSYLLVPPR